MPINEPRKFWMKWRVRLGYPLAIIYWLLAKPNPRTIVIGIALAGLGLVIRALGLS